MIIEQNEYIETILQDFKNELKNDFTIYKNHVYRIFNYACMLDPTKESENKYAIASAFHDIGIWTHSFDYLHPSIGLASEYLEKNKKEQWIEEISLMIDNHHKMSEYKGNYSFSVEIFRKADWIDVTKGRILFNFDKSRYKKVQHIFSSKGFHTFLIKQFLYYFLKHPFNPLPMFKK